MIICKHLQHQKKRRNTPFNCRYYSVLRFDVADVITLFTSHHFPMQPVKDFSPFGWTAKTEIAQMKDGVTLTDCIIPIGDYSLIHHFHILKRSVTETNDILMIKMGIGCKKHLTAIKFVVHFLLNLCASLHVNNPVTNSPSDGNGRRTSWKRLSQMGIQTK